MTYRVEMNVAPMPSPYGGGWLELSRGDIIDASTVARHHLEWAVVEIPNQQGDHHHMNNQHAETDRLATHAEQLVRRLRQIVTVLDGPRDESDGVPEVPATTSGNISRLDRALVEAHEVTGWLEVIVRGESAVELPVILRGSATYASTVSEITVNR